MLVADLFQARGVFMKDFPIQLSSGIFPSISESQFHTMIERVMAEICSKRNYTYVKCHFVPNYNNYKKDFDNISNIKELDPKKYNFYLEKIIQNYEIDLDNIELRVISREYTGCSETIIIFKLLPKKQSVKLTIKKNTFFARTLHSKEFSADTPFSSIQENIDHFYKKRNAEMALNELEQKYK